MERDRFYLPGLLYTGLLEIPLRRIRKRVRSLVQEQDLFPLLDLCCGPGTQAAVLRKSRKKEAVSVDINLRLLKYAASLRPGVHFVAADAARTPFQPGAFRGIIVSFALHEKDAGCRPRLLAEAKSLLSPDGRIILVDFEKPWNSASRLAYLYVSAIELLAGRRHFRNGRDFLRRGGLRRLLRENGLREEERYDIAAGACAVVLARPE